MNIASVTMLLVFTLACSGCNPRRILTSPFGPTMQQEMETAVFEAINLERTNRKLPAMQRTEQLDKLARMHTLDMIRMGKLSHEGSDGKTVEGRAEKLGIDWWNIGENVARNRGYSFPADKAVKDWMNSPPHKENIVNKVYIQTGVSVVESEDGNTYFTQVFLRPIPD